MKRSTFLISIILITLIGSAALHAQASPGVNYRQEGIASWYGPGFDGRATASGEIFDSSQFTAAHPFLPFGTVLTVTNKLNNRQVNVRVNDRGPFVESRIIDLSQAAARALDMITSGTAVVIAETSAGSISSSGTNTTPVPSTPPPTVTVLQSPPTPPRTNTPGAGSAMPQGIATILGGIPPSGTGKSYRLQVGAFRVIRNAVDAFERLRNVGLNPAYERVDSNLYRVVLAGLTPEEIEGVAVKLFSAGFTEALIREEF